MFGRKQIFIETINVYNSEIAKYVVTNIIKTIIPINADILTLLIVKNIDSKLISELNNTCFVKMKNSHNSIKSNVSIASAITSYARIYMMKFKINSDVYYTDTDSIFTKTKINPNLIGKELGLMKEELNGLTIKKCYFLGI